MSSLLLADVLALINDVLQSIIVIFGTAVVLYNSNRLGRSEVIRAFCAVVSFVVVVYLSELLVSRTALAASAELWLRIGWIGIAMVPAAQFHLSSALLTTTGLLPHRRRVFVPAGYLIGFFFAIIAVFTDYLVNDLVTMPHTVHLSAGRLFPVFAAYFWIATGSSIYNVWRARHRCLTSTTRRRMTYTLIAFLAAPLGVFPYMLLTNGSRTDVPLWTWPILILGNLIVSIMFGILTSQLAYFGSLSPDRVVRVRLYKFMARVPLAATIVLLVYLLVSRSSRFLGLPMEVALAISMVATVMVVEWIVHAYKKPLERLFQLNDDPDVRRIQELSERLLTTSDMQQFLESILAATCEAMRTPTAFIAAITAEGPHLESVVGPLTAPETLLQSPDLQAIALPNGNGNPLTFQDGFFLWHEYWIRPLHSQDGAHMLGILGISARAPEPDLSDSEQEIFDRLAAQARGALEDRILQQQVFATVEGLLPEIKAFQERRSAARYGGLPVLASDEYQHQSVTDDPEFGNMVRDALSHYWGGPKLTDSPLMQLKIVQDELPEHDNNPTNALRAILGKAIEQQRPEGQRNLTTAEWILYNILELKFVQGRRVRDVARRLAMSESDLYRKQRVAIENVARTISTMEEEAQENDPSGQPSTP